jgi:hypothetical protein
MDQPVFSLDGGEWSFERPVSQKVEYSFKSTTGFL